MATFKAGTRLRSSVCSTEVMVISVPDGGADLSCGGAPMTLVSAPPASGSSLAAGAAAGTKLGKRYVDESGKLEVLCTKAGEGSLSLGDERLHLKDAKPLPSSD